MKVGDDISGLFRDRFGVVAYFIKVDSRVYYFENEVRDIFRLYKQISFPLYSFSLLFP
jgi:TFIIF-interacting CTD phosphatase-like protein